MQPGGYLNQDDFEHMYSFFRHRDPKLADEMIRMRSLLLTGQIPHLDLSIQRWYRDERTRDLEFQVDAKEPRNQDS